MTLRAGNVSFAYFLRKINSDDVGFSIKVGNRIIYYLGNLFGLVENCLNVTIVSSFGSPTLWAFATRARSLEAQLSKFPKVHPISISTSFKVRFRIVHSNLNFKFPTVNVFLNDEFYFHLTFLC